MKNTRKLSTTSVANQIGLMLTSICSSIPAVSSLLVSSLVKKSKDLLLQEVRGVCFTIFSCQMQISIPNLVCAPLYLRGETNPAQDSFAFSAILPLLELRYSSNQRNPKYEGIPVFQCSNYLDDTHNQFLKKD